MTPPFLPSRPGCPHGVACVILTLNPNPKCRITLGVLRGMVLYMLIASLLCQQMASPFGASSRTMLLRACCLPAGDKGIHTGGSGACVLCVCVFCYWWPGERTMQGGREDNNTGPRQLRREGLSCMRGLARAGALYTVMSSQGVTNQGVMLPTRVLYCPPRVFPTQQPCCCPTLPCSTCQGLLLQPL
jgi:hypothetical protein